jgi:hypothetical protein
VAATAAAGTAAKAARVKADADTALKDADAARIEARETLSQIKARSDDLTKAQAAVAKASQAADARAKSFQVKIDQLRALCREVA